ncbi:MAG: ShlB/FhaC/HecB family hemolysin secretion/activation protein, partial [Selenomonadaceae bacterium]|nr:ShlB/FhaC/HecB family hemolysin secretion/activation protein [Selenomonadaceae bacterium]
MRIKTAIIFFCGLFVLSNAANAETLNTADISRESARQAAGEPGESTIERTEMEEGEPQGESDEINQDETFELRGVNIDSDIKEIKQSHVQHIVDPYIGKRVNIHDLRKIASEIKMFCRQQGWLAAVAYLPEQDSTDGVITFKIMSPNFGKVTFKNQSRLDDDILRRVGSNIKSTDMVQNDKIEDVLYLINEIGGVKARGALIPDTLTRKIDLNINVVNDQTKRGIIYAENYGSKNSGRYRLGVIYDMYNLDNRGSRLEVSGLISNEDLDNYVFDYSIISRRKSTSRLGISFGRTTYHLVQSSIPGLEAGGHSTDLKLYGMTPVWKTIHDGFVWNYGYKFRDYTQTVSYKIDLSDYGLGTFSQRFQGQNYIHTFSLGFSGYKRSLHNDLFNYSFTLYDGHLSPRTESAREMAEDGYTDGNFIYSEIDLDYRKLFSDYWEFHTNFNLQNSSKNLVSAEQMTLGGANGVRGYADGDASGDEGYLSKSEIVWH